MKFVLAGLACSMALLGCSSPDQPTVTDASPTSAATASIATAVVRSSELETMARYNGYGDMRFGMDETTFDKTWGGELKGAPEQGSSCYYKTPKWVKLSSEFAFMFEHGHFVRYDVGTSKDAAPGGGEVGMSADKIRQLYGPDVVVQPHKYVQGAKYLRVAASEGAGVLVFETDAQGKVTRWHVGLPPQVDYVEGCS
ncbi:MAG: lectin [Rhodanobacter sp.]